MVKTHAEAIALFIKFRGFGVWKTLVCAGVVAKFEIGELPKTQIDSMVPMRPLGSWFTSNPTTKGFHKPLHEMAMLNAISWPLHEDE